MICDKFWLVELNAILKINQNSNMIVYNKVSKSQRKYNKKSIIIKFPLFVNVLLGNVMYFSVNIFFYNELKK